MADELSPAARRRALLLRLNRIQRKVATAEAELAAAGGANASGLFQDHGVRSLQERLTKLRETSRRIEVELRH